MSFRADDVRGIRIPNDDIGVTTGRDSSFARVKSKKSRGSCGDKFDETIHAELAFVHAVMEKKLETIFHPGATVGNFREVILAENFLILETEGAMIGRDDLQMIVLQAVPQFRKIFFFAQRRSENIFRAFKIRAL